jgi:hypothetical protein
MVVSFFERVHLLEPCRGVSPSLSLTAGSNEPDGGTESGRCFAVRASILRMPMVLFESGHYRFDPLM